MTIRSRTKRSLKFISKETGQIILHNHYRTSSSPFRNTFGHSHDNIIQELQRLIKANLKKSKKFRRLRLSRHRNLLALPNLILKHLPKLPPILNPCRLHKSLFNLPTTKYSLFPIQLQSLPLLPFHLLPMPLLFLNNKAILLQCLLLHQK